MRNSQPLIMLLFILFFIIIDIYTYFGLKTQFNIAGRNLNLFRIIYISSSIMVIGGFFALMPILDKTREPAIWYWTMLILAGGMFLLFIPKINYALFHLIEQVTNLIASIFSKNPVKLKIIDFVGFVISSIIAILILFGILIGRFNFMQSNVVVESEDINKELKIVQLSDIHLGSFYGHKKRILKEVEKINALSPDLIFLTGDFVNHFSNETKGWKDVFEKLNAKYGVYSVLGNHDYGDYLSWPSKEEKLADLEKLIKFQESCGFEVLRNENRIISHEGTKIAIIGVENWGKPPFHQYGDLEKATNGVDSINFKLLLSHDPSHWRAEILNNTDIDMTFSGHTHAMQMGIDIGKIKFSPSKWIYPEWHGLYKERNRYLYVSRGFGHIGLPARIGMRPEVAVITIKPKGDE